MKKMLTMLYALTLISIFHSCQDEELEVQTVSVNPVEQEIIEETPFTLDEIDDVLLVNQYDNLNSLSKTILKEKLATLYSDKVDLINWDSVRLNTDYIYLEDQTTDSKIYRFLIDMPRVESDGNFIPPLVNLRVNYDIVNNDILSDLHINDQDISESLTFDLEGVVTNESSKDIVKQSARTGGSNCICVLQITGDVVSRIRWIHSSPSGNYPSGGGYSPHIASAPAAVWLQYARKTGNSQILSAFGIVHIAGVAWNNEISAKYMTPPSRTHTTNDLYIVGSDPNTFSPFTTRYFYYFPELRGLITNFYNKVWVHQLGSYYTTTSLPYNQHIRRQTFIDSFMSWSYNVQRQNGNLFQYLSNNPNAMEKIFNLFAQYHLDNRDTMLTVGYNPGANYSSNKDVRFASWLSSYLLNNNIDLIKAYVDGNISQSQLESIGNYELNIKRQFLQAVQNDPYLLIDTNSSQLPKWKQLAQHKAPTSVQNKIDNLPHGWANNFEIQDISDASGTAVNMDYFSVNVTQLPINPSTRKRFTADEFLQYFRKNINNFVNNSRATFYPYCKISYMCHTETMLWNSSNPLGAIVYIDIPEDTGVVALTEFTNNHWNFMTMNAPYAGNHPVSGTRQFGYEKNANGSYSFYVRGVDRIDSNGMENIAWSLSIVNGEWFQAFAGADRLWESFQSKMNTFVNTNGGRSSIVTPIKERPDWNKVKDVLLGKKQISDL